MTILVLGRDGMGPNSDEARFRAWVIYVELNICERCDFVVDVERRGKHDVQTDAVFDASQEELETVEEARRELWEEWCANGAPAAEPPESMSVSRVDPDDIRKRVADLRRVARNQTMAQQRVSGIFPALLLAVCEDVDALLALRDQPVGAPRVEGVTTWGLPGPGGGRTSSFEHEGLHVSVRPPDAESTEAAFGYACELAAGARALADKQALVEQLKASYERKCEEVRKLHARVEPDPVRLLGTGCIRFRDGALWLLNSAREGWASFGIRCEGWDDLFRRFNVYVKGTDCDVWGDYWIVENLDAEGVEAIKRTSPERR